MTYFHGLLLKRGTPPLIVPQIWKLRLLPWVGAELSAATTATATPALIDTTVWEAEEAF